MKHVSDLKFVVYYFVHLDYEVCVYFWLILFICDIKKVQFSFLFVLSMSEILFTTDEHLQ